MKTAPRKNHLMSAVLAALFWLAPQVTPPQGMTLAIDPAQAAGEQKIFGLLAQEAPHLSGAEQKELAHALVSVADANHLDPLLVMALIRVESRYRPFARSSVGAQGLMQVRADTGEHLAKKIKHRWHSSADLYEVQSNLMIGTAYLKTLVKRSKNNLAVALTAYNYGPSRTFQWVREGKPLPKGYAERVMRAYQILRARSQEQNFTSLAASITL